MSDTIIKVENLSKKYIIGHQVRGGGKYVTLRDVIADKTKRLFSFGKNGKPDPAHEEFWALKDVSFEVKQGDRLGIIGRNGAGKSTLLKVLSRIVEPTTGRISIRGRVASLLEVGTGFHPELTGRENIFLNGAILGMSKAEIKKKFDEIVAFSEIEKFLDTPVKRYSSGMYVRLAFAVAAFLEPDILVVDEVLSVGDAQFQKKCLGKIESVSSDEGRTVLFVSHSMETILRLCSSVILLKDGMIAVSGETSKTVTAYLKTDLGITSLRRWNNGDQAPGNHIVRLMEVRCHTEDGTVAESFDIAKPIGFTMYYEVIEEGHRFAHSCNLFNEQGVHVLSSHDVMSPIRNVPRPRGKYSATMWIPGNLLAEGLITVSVAIVEHAPFNIYFHEMNAVAFNVVDRMEGDSARGTDYAGGFPGVVRPKLQWSTRLIPNG